MDERLRETQRDEEGKEGGRRKGKGKGLHLCIKVGAYFAFVEVLRFSFFGGPVLV